MPDSVIAGSPATGAPTAGSGAVVGGRNSTLTISGAVGPTASIQSVDVGDFVGGVFQDLGTASLQSFFSGDSEYSFDITGINSNGKLYTKLTDTNGTVSYFSTDVSVETGIVGERFASVVDYYEPGTDTISDSDFIGRQGRPQYESIPEHLLDGGTRYTYMGGYVFDGGPTPIDSFADTYDSAGRLVLHTVFFRDQTNVTDVLGPGQTAVSYGNDTFNEFASATHFIIGRGAGAETFNDFKPGGVDHDIVSLPQGDKARLGRILADATSDSSGTTLHLGGGDTLTFSGVDAAALRRHPHDFTFFEPVAPAPPPRHPIPI